MILSDRYPCLWEFLKLLEGAGGFIGQPRMNLQIYSKHDSDGPEHPPIKEENWFVDDLCAEIQQAMLSAHRYEALKDAIVETVLEIKDSL